MWSKRAVVFGNSGFLLAALFVPLARGIGSFSLTHVESPKADLLSQYRADLPSLADLRVREIAVALFFEAPR